MNHKRKQQMKCSKMITPETAENHPARGPREQTHNSIIVSRLFELSVVSCRRHAISTFSLFDFVFNTFIILSYNYIYLHFAFSLGRY